MYASEASHSVVACNVTLSTGSGQGQIGAIPRKLWKKCAVLGRNLEIVTNEVEIVAKTGDEMDESPHEEF
ncbi:MAG: hypothetical protein ACRD2M_08450, partial [Terriglobales bacterium]